jgi:Zn-dependent membrane protease YugP
MGIVPAQDMGAVRNVLNAAALTYVAGALQSVMTLLYYLMIFMGSGSRRRD